MLPVLYPVIVMIGRGVFSSSGLIAADSGLMGGEGQTHRRCVGLLRVSPEYFENMLVV